MVFFFCWVAFSRLTEKTEGEREGERERLGFDGVRRGAQKVGTRGEG